MTMRWSSVTIGVVIFVACLGCDKTKSAPKKADKASAPSASAEIAQASKQVPAPPKAGPAPAAAPGLPAPKSLGAPRVPADNPMTADKVALGRKLFFDKRLSVDGTRACYSCHQNEDGTGGHEPTAIGAKDKALTRHAPVIWNVAYLPALYWDGRSGSLEAQAKGAWGGGNMGVGADNLDKKAKELGALPEYKPLFEKVFPAEGATANSVAQAISAYERTLVCGDTAFDRFFFGEVASAINAAQKKGWELFKGKAGCTNCHIPPHFSDAYTAHDGAYHNVGIGTVDKAEADVDVGRAKVSGSDSDWAAFKTPTLRNVTRSAPYFHDGSVADLEAAVRLMASGGYKNKNLDAKLSDKKLADDEIAALIAFLRSLECSGKLEDKP